MIVEYIRYALAPGASAAFEQAYAEAAVSLDQSEHCLGYELCRCAEEASRYILRIEWTSAEGHMQGFRNSALFAPFFKAVRPYVGQIEEMRHYQPTAVRGTGAGVSNRGVA